ncbi:MAG: hypothetical protein KDB35_10540 [Acidimicrobiales bacterium]|nr:hypothetical protein [Acidimicrobiales bacterium]MCB1014591.1 hypothetical protein [Acidimicrobiales bacterium]
MTRRLLLLAAALLLVTAACGSGVEEIGGGADVTVSDTKPDSTDTTDGDTSDTTAADDGDDGDLPPGQDPRNILGGEGQEEDDAAIACFEGDMSACDELFTITDVGSDLEAYSQTCGGRIDEVDGAPDCVSRFGGGDPEEPGNFDAEFEGLAQDCFDGDFAACDDLFFQTPIDSAEEEYGSTCGGRLGTGVSGRCEDVLGGSSTD